MLIYRPNVVDVEKVPSMKVQERLDYAFSVAEDDFGVARLLEPSGRENWKFSCVRFRQS